MRAGYAATLVLPFPTGCPRDLVISSSWRNDPSELNDIRLRSEVDVCARWEAAHESLPLTFISRKLFPPLQVQHLSAGSVEPGLEEIGSSN